MVTGISKKNVVLSFEPKENFDLTENTDTIKIGRQNFKQQWTEKLGMLSNDSPFFLTSGSYQCTFEASAPPAGGCKFSTLQTTRWTNACSARASTKLPWMGAGSHHTWAPPVSRIMAGFYGPWFGYGSVSQPKNGLNHMVVCLKIWVYLQIVILVGRLMINHQTHMPGMIGYMYSPPRDINLAKQDRTPKWIHPGFPDCDWWVTNRYY